MLDDSCIYIYVYYILYMYIIYIYYIYLIYIYIYMYVYVCMFMYVCVYIYIIIQTTHAYCLLISKILSPNTADGDIVSVNSDTLQEIHVIMDLC